MSNKELKYKYDEMHKQGASAWFSDGKEEMAVIIKMGWPWKGLRVLEIGCGEGDLAAMISEYGTTRVLGIDYSGVAIAKAHGKHETELDGNLDFMTQDFHKYTSERYDRIIMQGVLEHLDEPFTELKWMMNNLLGENGDIITSSPCFINPRGIVWMTLDMVGAVMSKTDLHFLHRWQFEDFCLKHGYRIEMESCDWTWGNDVDMIDDLRQRIPLALKDGKLPCDKDKIDKFLDWLHTSNLNCDLGATMVYHIFR